MVIYRCDFCGRQPLNASGYRVGKFTHHSLIIDNFENYDVCDECYDKILALAKTEREEQNNEEKNENRNRKI